ncbi:hypothetical protein ARMSODRAFT_877642, partial [Armillaria solidipes]
LNIKIARLATYMRDEEVYLSYMEKELSKDNPLIAFQVEQLHIACTCIHNAHCHCFERLSKMNRFCGSIKAGKCKGSHLGFNIPILPQRDASDDLVMAADKDNCSDNDGEKEEEVLSTAFNVLKITEDKSDYIGDEEC